MEPGVSNFVDDRSRDQASQADLERQLPEGLAGSFARRVLALHGPRVPLLVRLDSAVWRDRAGDLHVGSRSWFGNQLAVAMVRGLACHWNPGWMLRIPPGDEDLRGHRPHLSGPGAEDGQPQVMRGPRITAKAPRPPAASPCRSRPRARPSS